MHLKSCLKKVSYISVLLLDVHWTNNNGNWVEFSVGWIIEMRERERERENTVKTLTQQTPRKNSCC